MREKPQLIFLFEIKPEIKRSKQGGTWDSVSSANPFSKLFRRKWQHSGPRHLCFRHFYHWAFASSAEKIAKGFHSALSAMKNLSMVHKSFIHPKGEYLLLCLNPETYPFPRFCSKRNEARWCPKCAPHYTVLADPQHYCYHSPVQEVKFKWGQMRITQHRGQSQN